MTAKFDHHLWLKKSPHWVANIDWIKIWICLQWDHANLKWGVLLNFKWTKRATNIEHLRYMSGTCLHVFSKKKIFVPILRYRNYFVYLWLRMTEQRIKPRSIWHQNLCPSLTSPCPARNLEESWEVTPSPQEPCWTVPHPWHPCHLHLKSPGQSSKINAFDLLILQPTSSW